MHAIVKQGANKNRIVQTSLKDTKGRAVGDDEGWNCPTEEEVQEKAQRTQQALSVILDGKVNSSKADPHPGQCDPNQQEGHVRAVHAQSERSRGIPLLLLSAS